MLNDVLKKGIAAMILGERNQRDVQQGDDSVAASVPEPR